MKYRQQTLMEMTVGSMPLQTMVSILHGIDPGSVSLNVSVKRRHLQQELENNSLLCFNFFSTDHSVHGPKSNYLHRPFHSQTIYRPMSRVPTSSGNHGKPGK